MGRILVTEDDVHIRSIIVAFLESNGHDVMCANNGEDAVNLFHDFHPDVVFMDVNMPVKDGIEATEEIVSANPDAKICILSAIGHQQAVQTALNAGATTYLTKPFKKETLLKVIENLT